MRLLPTPETNHQPNPITSWLAMHAAWLKAMKAAFKHEFICKEPEITMQVRVDHTKRKAFRLTCTCCKAHADLPQEPLWGEAWAALESRVDEAQD